MPFRPASQLKHPISTSFQSLSRWHRKLDSQARAAHGENPNYVTYNNPYQQVQQQARNQYRSTTSQQKPLEKISSSTTLNLHQWPQQLPKQSLETKRPVRGVFGEAGWTNNLTVENSSPSPPPLPWSSCSMFMVASEKWPDGINSQADTIGEQLNTPRPEDVCGFEFESFGGFEGSETQNNLTNVSKSSDSSITKTNATVVNSSNNKNQQIISSMYGNEMRQPFGLKYNSYDLNNSGPITPPSMKWEEADVTAGFNSWESEPCLSPIYTVTPHQSSGVASPSSSTGGTEYQKTDEWETCVDFNTVILSPDTITDPSEGDDINTSLHDEIEQLSNSFYCPSNNLISIKNPENVEYTVSPIFLKLLQEEPTLTAAANTPITTVESNNYTSNDPIIKNGSVFETQPQSVANSFFSDAENEDTEHLDDPEEFKSQEKPGNDDVAIATATTQRTALQNVFREDEALDVKTQTQLEHNYTTKIQPFDGNNSLTLTRNNTVTEPLKPREILQQQRRLPQPAANYQKQIAQRQVLQRMQSKMAEANQGRQIPKLTLKIEKSPVNALADAQKVLNTPDLTNQLLELEAESFQKDEKPFDLLEFITSGEDYDEVAMTLKEEKPEISFIDESSSSATDQQSSTICAPTLSDLFNPAKRKLPIITIDNIDELTASTNPKKKFRFSAASSTTSSICGDNASEASGTRPQKRRGRPPKQTSSIRDRSEYQHLSEEDLRYREQRDKNNEASRKSRINRKDRENKLEQEADELNQQYRELMSEEQQLIKDCARWRKAVMRLALL